MASIIKGQILKHLSKFTKNMSPDKIHVSTLKGEGDLSNLELDEAMIMEVLDLPTWLLLTKAVCNRVAIKIQWTKLKNQPICIFLDEVVVEMETCEKPRMQTSVSQLANLSSGGKYGFAERIIDGMYVSINSVIVNFKAPAFYASIQLSRIVVQSKTPTWQNGDLRMTRIKDELRGELLIFKEAEWQTLRIEANALDGTDSNVATTPLRLIANQSKTRITIKKRLNDCGILSSKVQLNLDDLLWVLTDSQLKAAILFANSLREVVQKSSQQSKLQAAEKLQKQTSVTSGPAMQQARKPGTKSQIAIAKLFAKYDVVETSYHLHTGRIDLHLCDDMAPEDESYRRKVEGGAMQLTFHKLCLDFYPFHPGGSDRSHWIHSDDNMQVRKDWASELLANFKQDVGRIREAYVTSPHMSPDHKAQQVPLPPEPSKGRSGKQSSLAQGTASIKPGRPATATKLLESCFVMRLEDFIFYRVSTAADNKRSSPKKFFASDKKQLLLPPEMSSIHMEYTDYYFPEGIDYPVPHANMYVNVNPVRLSLDYLTLVWLNAFALNLIHSLDLPDSPTPKVHVDTRIDALMPRIILPAECDVHGQCDRPDGLQIQLSKVTMTNCRLNNTCSSLSSLASLLEQYENCAFFASQNFPHRASDLLQVPSAFRQHVERTDDAYLDPSIGWVLSGIQEPPKSPRRNSTQSRRTSSPIKGKTYYNMSTDSLKQDGNKDIWCIAIDQFWVDFVGVPSSKHRPVPFVESFPVTLWVSLPLISIKEERRLALLSQEVCANGYSPDQVQDRPRASSVAKLKEYYSDASGTGSSRDLYIGECEEKLADAHVIVDVRAKVNMEINHYQYLFLLRLFESISKYQEEILDDTKYILGGEVPVTNNVVAVVIKEVELALVCPPIPEVPSLSTSREDSIEDLPVDGGLEGEVFTCTDSAIGASLCLDEADKGMTSLHVPAPLNKSHSDTEILTNTSPQESDVFLLVNTHTSNIDINKPRKQGSQQGSPQIFVSGGSQLSDSQGSSPSDITSYLSGSSLRVGSAETLSSGMDKRSGEIRKSFNTAFSNLSKLTEKVKHNVKKDLLDIDDLGDDWDTLSIKSTSSDDEDFVVLKFQNERELPAFERHHSASDTTSMAGSDKDSSCGELTGSGRHKGVVSVVSFRLVDVAASIQMRAEDMAVAVQCKHAIPREYGNINLDKFQMKFSAGTKEEKEEPLPDVLSPPVKLRYQLGPEAEKLAPTAGKLGYLDVLIHDFQSTLLMSSVNNLVDLIEDEVIPEVMPMKITVANVDVTLKNDLPPTHPTSPGMIPLDLHVESALVTRAQDGVFRVTAESGGSRQQDEVSIRPEGKASAADWLPKTEHDTVESLLESLLMESEELKKRLAHYEQKGQQDKANHAYQPNVQQLEHENDQLRRQLEKVAKLDGAAINEKLHRDVDFVKEQQRVTERVQRENSQLVEQLSKQHDELCVLKEERNSLMTTIQLLQEELAVSENRRRKALVS